MSWGDVPPLTAEQLLLLQLKDPEHPLLMPLEETEQDDADQDHAPPTKLKVIPRSDLRIKYEDFFTTPDVAVSEDEDDGPIPDATKYTRAIETRERVSSDELAALVAAYKEEFSGLERHLLKLRKNLACVTREVGVAQNMVISERARMRRLVEKIGYFTGDEELVGEIERVAVNEKGGRTKEETVKYPLLPENAGAAGDAEAKDAEAKLEGSRTREESAKADAEHDASANDAPPARSSIPEREPTPIPSSHPLPPSLLLPSAASIPRPPTPAPTPSQALSLPCPPTPAPTPSLLLPPTPRPEPSRAHLPVPLPPTPRPEPSTHNTTNDRPTQSTRLGALWGTLHDKPQRGSKRSPGNDAATQEDPSAKRRRTDLLPPVPPMVKKPSYEFNFVFPVPKDAKGKGKAKGADAVKDSETSEATGSSESEPSAATPQPVEPLRRESLSPAMAIALGFTKPGPAVSESSKKSPREVPVSEARSTSSKKASTAQHSVATAGPSNTPRRSSPKAAIDDANVPSALQDPAPATPRTNTPTAAPSPSKRSSSSSPPTMTRKGRARRSPVTDLRAAEPKARRDAVEVEATEAGTETKAARDVRESKPVPASEDARIARVPRSAGSPSRNRST